MSLAACETLLGVALDVSNSPIWGGYSPVSKKNVVERPWKIVPIVPDHIVTVEKSVFIECLQDLSSAVLSFCPHQI